MTVLLLLMSLVSPQAASPAFDIVLTIERDHSSSSDQLTLCRVRAVNYGSRSWSGRSIAFEARAIRDGSVAETEHGRFGLTLLPYGSLETVIGFTGRFDRFEVSRVNPKESGRRSRGGSRGGSRTRGKGRKSN